MLGETNLIFVVGRSQVSIAVSHVKFVCGQLWAMVVVLPWKLLLPNGKSMFSGA